MSSSEAEMIGSLKRLEGDERRGRGARSGGLEARDLRQEGEVRRDDGD
jgi:hypothetical protein